MSKPGMAGKSDVLVGVLTVAGIAIAFALAVSVYRGLGRPMTSDAFYYLSIARSLAEGKGYLLKDGYWPDRPTLSRSPGWPFTVSLVLWAVGPLNPDLAMRVLSIVFHAAGAALTSAITFRVFRSAPAAVCAGALLAVHPIGLYLADEGASEPLFVTLSCAGTLLMLDGWIGCFFGVVMLGAAACVRPYLLLLAVVWPLAWVPAGIGRFECRKYNRSWSATMKKSGSIGFCILLLVIPSALWAWRNYMVSGRFPVLSSLQGQTFYGGNNVLTARPGQYWGYWVFPDSVPGEASMRELSSARDEVGVSDYYMQRGLKFLKENPGVLPLLLIGKLVRAYVPIPWSRSVGTVGISIFRWFFYALAAVGLWRLWSQTDVRYRTILIALAASNVLSVAIFWGCARFAYPLDPFLAPFAGMMCMPEAWGIRRNGVRTEADAGRAGAIRKNNGQH